MAPNSAAALSKKKVRDCLFAYYNCGLESRRGIVEYFVVSGRDLCVWLIAPPEDFGVGCCVIECGQVQ
jgi:hypothetical protein